MALGFAVGARGADHNRSGAYEVDFSDKVDRRHATLESVRYAIETEDRAALMDSMILCKFLRGVFSDPWTEWAGLLAAVTGWDIDAGELHDTARGIVAAKHAFNRREGWTRGEDTLPARLLDVPLTLPSGREAALTRERLDTMVDAYYRTRGLDLSVRERDPAEQLWP
jgi:aldehyde:ferredoxin oxidoreductase